MGNAQKPTPRTRHIDIKYFSLCEWIERDLMLLERIDTSINMSDHMTKNLQTILFHRHADFILGHVPPMYSPVYDTIVGTLTNHAVDIKNYTPPTFTTPTTAAAARIHAPIVSDYRDNPWTLAIGHGQYNPLYTLSTATLGVHSVSQFVDCGGVTSDRIVPDLTISPDVMPLTFAKMGL